MVTKSELARMIDHTLLTPEATPADVDALVKQAAELGTYSVCVSPNRLPVATPEGMVVATVVGFPSGAVKKEIKAAEAARAVEDGAQEIDMVIDVSLAVRHRFGELEEEIAAVRAACPAPVVVKVILETACLDDQAITGACLAAEQAGADFVKTSTGFHPAGGASVHAVELMSKTVGGRLGIKASGGIRSTETALAMVRAGATRLGLSSSATVLEGLDD
ncbi:deoxyribose-phosphate aldolase [Corynebacterium mendelii]|uniref:Deoxyribose-phosphate aldolase n=1 Tax=Corynebacterium mendelii TaxID=2765362 RepID=A0A939E1U9_9CORY|nr:deoxyribose-phosphate aldolase [Corynebacterium mendelii]MBN9645163.1 deoxyribose-phosphate aldolase [Corynebacterium mendelii]